MKSILTILLISFSALFNTVSAQKPVLDELKFTDRLINVRQLYCMSPGDYELYVNNTLKTVNVDYTVFFYGTPIAGTRGGVYHMETQFGFLSPGDLVKVREVCTGIWSDPVTVKDDYAYIEVAAGAGHGGNGIGPNDTSSPYGRLSTPLSVGKCSPSQVNGHVLFPVTIKIPGIFDGPSTGIFKINGSPISNYGFDVNFGGETTNYTINPNGSITFDNFLGLTTSTYFSGASPVTIEYQHNGTNPSNDFSIGVGGVEIRFIKNNSAEIWKRNFLGDFDVQFVPANPNSVYKITFNEGEYKVYIDNVEKSSLNRFVIYNATNGGISNTGTLPYKSPVTFQSFASGPQTITALFDGAVTTYQKINVAEDIVINETITNVACNGGNTGNIAVSPNGGLSPLQYSLDGITYQGGNSFGGLVQGNYTLYVRDASGCTVSKTVYVGENPPLNLSAGTVLNAQCNGESNGSVQLNASGGAGFFEYGVNNASWQTSDTFTGLAAGNYSFQVRDAAGCVKSINQTIGHNSVLLGSVGTQVNVSCLSGNDGSVNISTAGSAPSGTLQYSKDGLNFQTSPLFTGLAAGNYTFIIKDNICQTAVYITITEPALLTASATVTQHVSCFGASNGQIVVNGGGGTQAYEYSQDGINYVNNNTFSNLTAGNYKFWVRDANGCITQTVIYTITQPAALQAGLQTKTAVKCFGGNDGSATIIASGGITDYTYSVDGINFQSSNVFSGLNAGNKTFTVKDANGCIKTVTADIYQPAAPFTLSVSQQDNLVCNSDNSGKVVVSAQGGTPAYLYSIDNINFQSGNTFTDLAAGSYSIFGKDANSCTFSTSTSINQPEPIYINHLKKLDVDCDYYEKGELVFAAAGSNGGFSYHLSGTDLHHNNITGVQNSDGVFTELSVGNYIMTAVDSKGCRKDYIASIVPKSSGIRFEVSKQLPANCTTTDGKIVVINTTGGRPQPDYHYRISSAAGFTASNSFENLTNGNYIITVADELCSYNQEVDLKLPQSLTAGYKISPIDCQTPRANVYIDPISGGNGNYELAMNGPFSNNRTFGNLNPGTYAVLIKDNPFSCHTTLSFEVKEQNRADLKTDHVQDVSCYGGSDGVIRVKGDNNVGPFTYSFNDQNNFTANNEFSGLPVGTYKIYAQNAMGCRDTIKVSLHQPTRIEWNVLTRNNDCFGDKTGEISISGTGGTPPYKFAIDNNFTDSGDFRNLLAGNYTTRIKDSKQCEFSKNTELIQPTEVKLTPVYQDTIRCYGENNGVVTINAEGGTPGYIYAMNDSTQFGNAPLFKDLVAGTYKFYVKDSKQCFKQTELVIKQPDKLVLSLLGQSNPLCRGEKNGTISIEAKGGNSGYIYIMDNVKQQKSGRFEGLTDATYTFKVTDRKACEDTISRVRLTWPKALTAAMNITPPVCFGDSNGVLKVDIAGGTAPYEYSLSNAGESVAEIIPLTSAALEVAGLSPGMRFLSLHDKNGCGLQLNANVPAPDKLNPVVFDDLPKEVCKGQEVWLVTNNTGKNTTWYFNDTEIPQANVSKPSEFRAVEPGKYKVTIKNSTGCTVSNTYELKNNNQAMIADFLMTIQAFEGDTVYALDISKPAADEVIWKLPQDANIIHQDLNGMTFQMIQEGIYTIEMLARKGECNNRKVREIEIFKKEDIDKTSGDLFYGQYDIIKSMSVFPNPNYGKFELDIKLSKIESITVSITRASNGSLLYKEEFKGQKDYIIPVQLKNFMQDNYLVSVKAGNTVLMKRVLLMN